MLDLILRQGHQLSWQVFCGVPQPLQEYAGTVTRLGLNRFLPNPFQFIGRSHRYWQCIKINDKIRNVHKYLPNYIARHPKGHIAIYNLILIIVGGSVAYNFQTENKIQNCLRNMKVYCSIVSINNKTFWVTLSYSVNKFVLFYPVWKL
jgi:hypothetical protein